MSDQRSFRLLGVDINTAPFHAVLAAVIRAPETGERLALHFADAHTVVEAHDNSSVRDALAQGIVEPDGMPLVWLGRRAGFPMERVCGPDFMPAVIEHGVAHGRSHFFYGGAPGVAERLEQRFARLFPGARFVGTLSPPFRALTAQEETAVVEQINAAAPDYVWVGLGAPKQDLWVARHRAVLTAPVLLAVGAAFDYHAGTRPRAPRWMQRSGTEWLFRLASEPRRLAGRYIRGNAQFLRLIIVERTRRRR